ncbi:ATP-binding protein [uncultured Sphingobium sp.]|uniref:ATP-binding protein n=1 Tax=uncultured Sphingobium sp. TaxID=316087 RepID=UPI00259BC645|nr:ATP-binding protein [uncultured Sphingobium sp.]
MNDLAYQPQLDLGERPRGHAPLTNMSLFLRTAIECQEAGADSPRMGLFYGYSGYGKTIAASFVTARTGAVYVAAQSVWSQRSLLEAIAEELGITRLEKTAPKILRQIVDQLNHEPRTLIIDETDHLVNKRSVEIIRDIHDSTQIAILMIGEEALPAKLKEWERFDNRILIATPAQPASIADAYKLRDHYCTRVRVADDLAELFQARCNGITRRIVTNLRAAQRAAAEEGLSEVNREWWGNRSILNGDLPVRRKAVA